MNQQPIERVTFAAQPHATGHFSPYRNWGGYEWRTDTPDDSETAVILADYGNVIPTPCFYYKDRFRTWSGNRLGVPHRWFYYRPVEDVLHPGGAWMLPDGTDPPPTTPTEIPPLLQRLVDTIKREWPWQLAMDAADLSPYDEPDIGAPLS